MITSWEISILIHSLYDVSQKEIEKGLQNLLHPGFCSVMTGLNREKRCKLAAVFADKLIQCSDKVASKIVPVIFYVYIQIIFISRDLSICSNAYSNGNHRACHAAAGFYAKTRYNFTRLGCLVFLHGTRTTGSYIFSVHFMTVSCADFGNGRLIDGLFFASSATNGRPDPNSTQTAPGRLD